MKIIINGKTVKLSKKDFVSQGGEGSIYERGGTAYKIYADSSRMIPLGKIQELSALESDNIIKPDKVISSSGSEPIGYTMKFVKDTYSLAQLFTKAFKDRNAITPEMSLSLIKRMQDTINHIHSKDILVVDLNEMNFLSDKNFTEVYFIDVDSYQTRNFPATAIMESIRDRQNKEFSAGTDWFSFAIISFQLFVGIHPYKGKHQTFKGLDNRMGNNISVLNKEVRIPKSCLPFNIIPPAYMDWYKAVLEEGKRLPPPSDIQAVVGLISATKTVISSGALMIDPIKDYDGSIIRYISNPDTEIVITDKHIYVDDYSSGTGENYDQPQSRAFVTGFTNRGSPVVAYINKDASKDYGNIILNGVRKPYKPQYVDFVTDAHEITDYNGIIYVKSGPNVVEILLRESPSGTIIASPVITANIAEKSSSMFDGCLIQNLLGSYYASIFPESGKHYQFKIDELDGYRIIDAKYDNNVMMIIGIKDGKYDRFVLRMNDRNSSYDMRKVEDIIYSGLNFVVLDSGICISINEDDKVELFSNKMNSTREQTVEDPAIDGSMRLFKNGSKVLIAKSEQLYSVRMK